MARLLLSILACAAAGACSESEAHKDGSKYAEGERLRSSLPVYPGFSAADSSPSATAGEAQLRQEYRSPAAFEEVKRFYLEKLPGEHWQYVRERALKYRGRLRGERSLEFRQGDYELEVRYAGERAGELGWDYAVTVR